jgi:hypothetical protein
MLQEPEDSYRAALNMVELFAASGADHFDVTLTTLAGEKIRYHPNVPLDDVRRKIPASLDLAKQHQQNIILRPRASDAKVFFVQLDDLNAQKLLTVQDAAFFAIETSPGNFQGWVAIAADGADEKEVARALRKVTGADMTASGATRLAGTRNFKEKYAPDYPTVTITHSNLGLVMTVQQLKTMGLLNTPACSPLPKPIPRTHRLTNEPRRFPSYDRCLQNAPTNSQGNALDTSRADYVWCMIAIDWGFSIEETAAQLLKERVVEGKKQRNGENYALLTARNAATAVLRNRERGR